MCVLCKRWSRLPRRKGGPIPNYGRCVAKPADNPFWMTPWSPTQLPVPDKPCVTTHATGHGKDCAAFVART